MGCGTSSQAHEKSTNAPEKKPDTPVKEVKEEKVEVKEVEQKELENEESNSNEEPSSNEIVIKTETTVVVKNDETKEEMILETKTETHVKFDQQMGGHEGTFHKVDEHKIMKHGGKDETAFYEEIHLYPTLQSFAPSFHGIKEVDDKKYIVIEDLTHGFKKPCILDVKIGRQSYGEDASPEKKASMEAKDKKSTTWTLGARITAMKVYQTETGDYIKKGKAEGKDVTTENFRAALSEYFHNGKELRKELIPKFLEKIYKIKEWIESQSELRLYSSSILFVYDGEGDNDNVVIRIIDFAHVFKIADQGKDEGYIFGVNNLISHLEGIAAQE